MKKRGRFLVDLALSERQNQENDSLVANTCRDNLQTSNPSPCPTIEGSPNVICELLTTMDWSCMDPQKILIENENICANTTTDKSVVQREETPIILIENENMCANTTDKSVSQYEETTIVNEILIESENVSVNTKTDNSLGQPEETPILNEAPESIQDLVILQNVEIEEITVTAEPAPALTKKGTIRKRKPKISKQNQEEIKKQKRIEKHSLREAPCVKNGCKLKCITRIPEEQRKKINTNFVNMTWNEQHTFLIGLTSKENVKRHYTTLTADEGHKRNMSVKYYSLSEKGQRKDVCKSFFLTTLGFHEKNDSVVYKLLSKKEEVGNSESVAADGRGKTPAVNKIDRQPIIEQIESYNPSVSHYRREHAPNVRYLPSDVTVTDMYQNFLRKNPHMEISYDLYRKVVKSMRIHFTKLGHEECEDCEDFKLHDKDHTKNPENHTETCTKCAEYLKHRKRAEQSRLAYKADAEKDFPGTDICISADLQKIIMLPRIDTFKTVLFTPRLIAYNESFVRVGTKQKNLYPYAAIWHEAISGRSKEDIISTYYAFICFHRDAKKITIWADNCSAQNKNWTFFSFLIYIVNSDEVALEEIIVKYFEAGHTFMSADTFHHCVEKSLKSQGKTYDFNDFEEAVRKATSTQVNVKLMGNLDFFQWKDYSSIYKLKNKKFNSERPYVADIVTIRAVRGIKTLAYRTSYDGKEVEMNFLNRAGIDEINKPQANTRTVGIKEDRKKGIIDKLGRLMPKNRLTFWENLPICSE